MPLRGLALLLSDSPRRGRIDDDTSSFAANRVCSGQNGLIQGNTSLSRTNRVRLARIAAVCGKTGASGAIRARLQRNHGHPRQNELVCGNTASSTTKPVHSGQNDFDGRKSASFRDGPTHRGFNRRSRGLGPFPRVAAPLPQGSGLFPGVTKRFPTGRTPIPRVATQNGADGTWRATLRLRHREQQITAPLHPVFHDEQEGRISHGYAGHGLGVIQD